MFNTPSMLELHNSTPTTAIQQQTIGRRSHLLTMRSRNVANDDGTDPALEPQHLRIASTQAVEDFKFHGHPSSAQLVAPTGPLDLPNGNRRHRRSSLSPLVEATLRRSSSYHGNGDGLLSSAAARPLWGLKRRNRQSTSSPVTSLAAPRLPSSSSREVPIPGAGRASSSPAFFDEECRARQKAHYENATWNMYERIVEGRRRQMVLT